jgi:ABC-type branched-subunit amino acid transport system ATPase component
MLEVSDPAAGYGCIPIPGGVSFGVALGEFVRVLGHNLRAQILMTRN